MITLHKMNEDSFILNAIHIETIEERPDTVITLTNDKKYLVKESIDEIIEKIVAYEKQINIRVKKFSIEEDHSVE